jgi:hypothetical protein
MKNKGDVVYNIVMITAGLVSVALGAWGIWG